MIYWQLPPSPPLPCSVLPHNPRQRIKRRQNILRRIQRLTRIAGHIVPVSITPCVPGHIMAMRIISRRQTPIIVIMPDINRIRPTLITDAIAATRSNNELIGQIRRPVRPVTQRPARRHHRPRPADDPPIGVIPGS